MRCALYSLAWFQVTLLTSPLSAEEWSIPLVGNAYRTAPEPGAPEFQRGGTVAWDDAEGVFSVFFHVSCPAVLDLSLNARVPDGRSSLVACVEGRRFTTTMEGSEFRSQPLGRIDIPRAGYIRLDLQGATRTGKVYAEILDLEVVSQSEGVVLDYVRTNEGNMFYWGRRGPSVHLTYQVPNDRLLQFAYSEIVVPEGQDVLGSFFMANGFGEGYFGIQVNSSEERRVLFSIWSPFSTDDPSDIPEDQRVVPLARGPGVRLGDFGNEGSGGQSYLVHPWKAGTTYKFLTEVKPDDQGNTIYTSWFYEKAIHDWRLIASFRRPKTTTHLRGFHSFLENFAPTTGHLERRAHYGNIWVRDLDRRWHECTQARFSVDPTGGGRHRLDFTGGAEREYFFLRNCGFFSDTGNPGAVFTRHSRPEGEPTIDFDALPRN